MAKQQVTRKRTQLRKKKSDGIDPRILALGAGAAGAVVGRAVARAKNDRSAKRSVQSDVAFRSATLNNEYGSATRNAAKDVFNTEYRGMPRVSSAKMNVAKSLAAETRNRYSDSKTKFGMNEYNKAGKDSLKKAGLSRSEIKKVAAKRNAQILDSYGNTSTERFMEGASRIRSKSTATRAGRRGAVGGAIGAASVAMIVAQVLKELNKK